MSQSNISTRLFVAVALCAASLLPVVAQAKTDHTANHIAKMDKQVARNAAKAAHRDASNRSDADKVVDNLTMPEKKVFRGMTSAEKSVARHMAHIARQIL